MAGGLGWGPSQMWKTSAASRLATHLCARVLGASAPMFMIGALRMGSMKAAAGRETGRGLLSMSCRTRHGITRG